MPDFLNSNNLKVSYIDLWFYSIIVINERSECRFTRVGKQKGASGAFLWYYKTNYGFVYCIKEKKIDDYLTKKV